MNARHWVDSASSLTHGNIVQRVLFHRRTPENASVPGAVMAHAESFARGCLEPGVTSLAQTNRGVEQVFFIAGGSGSLISDGDERRVREGDGILMPPDVEHVFRNDGDEPLELLIIAETIPTRTRTANAAVKIRNYRDADVCVGHWHHLARRIFGPEDGLANLHTVLVVRMEPMTTSEPHGHDADIDEVWYMWKGSGVHVVGREVCVQTPGMAIQVAPSDPGHALTNHTAEPLEAFYFSYQPK